MDNISKLPSEDGASERLVGEANDQKVEIKYMADSQNGDTKINIENLKNAFVGMGKEELMKYANDPFWVKMRWFLFILFWVLWFAMLCGAIAIIVLAPKCAAPTPREWYEQSPLYKVRVKEPEDYSILEINNLEDFEEHLKYYEDLGIDTIMVDSLMKSTDGNSDLIEDFMSLDPSFGTVSDFKKLTGSMKDHGLHLLMSLVPNFSSNKHEWFMKSVAKEEPFKDYYIWAQSKGINVDGQRIPPNNWLSVTGGSAWEWNEIREEFYLHQFSKSQPDLNFRNEAVVNHFKDILEFWLKLGLSGFHLNHVEYLLEDESLRNESVDNLAIGATHDQYMFYTHRHTKHLPGTVKLVKDWANVIHNHSGILAVTGLNPDSGNIGQLSWNPIKVSSELDAESLMEIIQKKINTTSSPVWEWTCDDAAYCLDEGAAKGLQLTFLLLPGTTVIKSGEELGILKKNNLEMPKPQNSTLDDHKNDPDSGFNTYKNLIEARHSPSIMYGKTQAAVLNSTIFAYSRIKSGNPGYLVAFNLGSDEATVNIQELKAVPDEVTVVARSAEFEKNVFSKNKISSAAVTIPSKGTLVLTFVPEAK